MRVRTIGEAAAFVDEVGIAVLFPKADLVLPSLWEAVGGPGPVAWGTQEESGKWTMTPEFSLVWGWKDELPALRRACTGKHLGPVVALVAPRLVGTLYAVTGRSGALADFREGDAVDGLQRDVAEAVLEHGPGTAPEIRRLLATDDRRRVASAIQALQRQLVLTSVGVAEQQHGWGANTFDLVSRHWQPEVQLLPPTAEARLVLARTVIDSAGEVSAADLGAALGWRARQAGEILDALAAAGLTSRREEDGITLWRR